MTEIGNVEKLASSVEPTETNFCKSNGISDNVELEVKESDMRIKSNHDENLLRQDLTIASSQNCSTYSVNTALTSASLPIISNTEATDPLNRKEGVITNVDN